MGEGKKTAIVAGYYRHNYGGQLQAFATQMALDRLGVENETVNVSGFQGEILKAKKAYFAKAALTSDFLFSKAGRIRNALLQKFSRSEYQALSQARGRIFDEFVEKNIRLSPAFPSIRELGSVCEDRYCAVLLGSDQLWLPGNIATGYFTLEFVPDRVNTIAYATSFGQSSLPADSAKRAAVFLKKIRHISVREESGQKLVKELSGRKVPVLCDPTMLFTGEEWAALQEEKPIIEGRYIFCYFLGENPRHRDFVRRLKVASGCRIVALLHLDVYVKEDEKFADETPYDVGPLEFLNLIRHAEYVCTDSYHGAVFSILYNRPFFAFRRFSGKSRQSTNSRMDTLFHMTGIRGRLLTGEEKIEECLKIPYDEKQVQSRVKKIRDASLRYLEHALRDKDTDL